MYTKIQICASVQSGNYKVDQNQLTATKYCKTVRVSLQLRDFPDFRYTSVNIKHASFIYQLRSKYTRQ